MTPPQPHPGLPSLLSAGPFPRDSVSASAPPAVKFGVGRCRQEGCCRALQGLCPQISCLLSRPRSAELAAGTGYGSLSRQQRRCCLASSSAWGPSSRPNGACEMCWPHHHLWAIEVVSRAGVLFSRNRAAWRGGWASWGYRGIEKGRPWLRWGSGVPNHWLLCPVRPVGERARFLASV